LSDDFRVIGIILNFCSDVCSILIVVLLVIIVTSFTIKLTI
jgi:hypothetical protein